MAENHTSRPPSVIGGKRRLHPLQEHEIMPRSPRRPADGRNPLHHVRVQRPPLVSLLRPHGPPHHHRNPLDTEHLRNQPVLATHVVIQRHPRKPSPVIRHRRIRRRRRKPVSHHVRHDDEIPFRVQRLPRPDNRLISVMLPPEERGNTITLSFAAFNVPYVLYAIHAPRSVAPPWSRRLPRLKIW